MDSVSVCGGRWVHQYESDVVGWWQLVSGGVDSYVEEGSGGSVYGRTSPIYERDIFLLFFGVLAFISYDSIYSKSSYSIAEHIFNIKL